MIYELSSLQNPKLKQLLKLKLNRKERDESQLFFLEGFREIQRAKEANVPFEQLFFCKELFLQTNEMPLIESIACEKYQITQQMFEKVSYRDRPDGLVAIARQQRKGLLDFVSFIEGKKELFLCIAESIEKPGNLGSILRSCDGAGVDALVLADRCTDLYNPNVVRSSTGTLFSLPCFELSSEELLPLLRKHEIQMVAATPHTTKMYTDVTYNKKVALAVGTEQVGLSDLWMNQAEIKVKIPMLGMADSLNVANATTLLLYEIVRQRSHPV